MISVAKKNSVIRAFDLAVSNLGVLMTWTKAPRPGTEDFLYVENVNNFGQWNDEIPIPYSKEVHVRQIVAGFKIAGKDDIEVVNAYGIETRIITISKNVSGIEPGKFDEIKISGLRYTIQAVHEVFFNEVLIGYRCYARGS